MAAVSHEALQLLLTEGVTSFPVNHSSPQTLFHMLVSVFLFSMKAFQTLRSSLRGWLCHLRQNQRSVPPVQDSDGVSTESDCPLWRRLAVLSHNSRRSQSHVDCSLLLGVSTFGGWWQENTMLPTKMQNSTTSKSQWRLKSTALSRRWSEAGVWECDSTAPAHSVQQIED